MTATLISIISIFLGIVGANLTGAKYKEYSFGPVGNTIAGVFGSVFFIKSIGRLGFDPISVMESGSANISLFIINSIVSLIGGSLAIIIAKYLKMKMENPDSFKLNGIDMLNVFRITSFLEGISYILLLFIGVPIKYIRSNDSLVKLLGMPHGLLFLTYIVLALLITRQMNWNGKTTLIVLVASLLPFGTFYINREYLKNTSE